MIDGVKIELPKLTAERWMNNPRLKFQHFSRAEIYKYEGRFYVAECKGLQFFIWVEKSTDKVLKCEIRGSLHRFYNNGKHNADDFTPDKLKAVINELETHFNIDRHTAILHNLEIGVNVYTPITAKEIIRNLVAYKKYEFVPIRIKRKTIGKKIEQQRGDFKAYDKGKEFHLKEKNLTRFEFAFSKMITLQPYGIKTLADLTDTTKIKPLISFVLEKWDNTIYYDKSINLKDLTPIQQRRVLYCATPRNWTELKRVQRMRAKKRFNELMNQYGSTTKEEIRTSIIEKWEELTAEKCIRFNRPIKETRQLKSVYVLTDIIHGYNVYNLPLEIDKKKLTKKPIKIARIFSDFQPKTIKYQKTKQKLPKKPQKSKTRHCRICGTNINHKRIDALYCGKACNNKMINKRRKKVRQMKKQQEIKHLEKLLKNLNCRNMTLTVTYKANGIAYTDTLNQSEIHTTGKWIRKVCKVIVTYRKNAKAITLTSYRAKQLIKEINNINQNNKYNESNSNNIEAR